MRSTFKLLAIAAFSALVFQGCSQRLSQTGIAVTGVVGVKAGSFNGVYQILNDNNCVSCHSPGGAAHDISGVELDFSSISSAYQALTADFVTGTSSTGICGGVRIVAPGKPSASYIAAVLFSDYNTADFGGMQGCQPYSGHLQDTNLSGAEKAALISWIQSGAQNN
jgi:hypothetical protein